MIRLVVMLTDESCFQNELVHAIQILHVTQIREITLELKKAFSSNSEYLFSK